MNVEGLGEQTNDVIFSENILKNAKELQIEGKAPALPDISEASQRNIGEQYVGFREQVLDAIKEVCSKNEYHNQNHTIEVEDRFEKLAKEAALSDTEIMLGKIRAIFHDYGHAGRTIRQDVQINRDESNEEFAAVEAGKMLKEWLRNKGLEEGKDDQIIAYVQFGILGTSFGQTSGKYERPYKPVDSADKLLAFADIGGFAKGFDGWMKESLNVFRETPFENLPKDADDMIEKRKGFLKYIVAKFNEIKPLLNKQAAVDYEKQLKDVELGLNNRDTTEYYRKEFDTIRSAA